MRALIARLLSLAQPVDARRRLACFACCALAAIVIGFVAVPPRSAEKLIISGGYYYILALVVLFVAYGVRVLGPRREVWLGWLQRPGWVGIALVAATVFAIWADDFKHKILFDEYVLQGTAWQMHATKEIGTPLRAYDISGTWLTIDMFLDKRPYFFTFLLSLLHDLSGFRLENVFVLNLACTSVCLALTYWLAHVLTGKRGPALLAVALLVTLPLFGQNATGAGMEMHNLAMLTIVMASAILYLQAPDRDRLAFLVLGSVLLSQSRYESVLFVVPVAAIIAIGWWRVGQVLLPWPAVVVPLLLVPYAWHSRVVDTKKALWQLREGETSRFAWSYLAGNLEGAWNFFFATSPGQPNSLWLTIVGIVALGWTLVRLVGWLRRAGATRPAVAPGVVVVALCGLAILGNVALLMFYYWSRFDEPVAARFALPSCLLLAVLVAWMTHTLDLRRWPATRIVAFGLAVWLLSVGARTYSRRIYTTQNLVMREMDWELERAKAHAGPILYITQKATIPFLLEHIATVNTASMRTRVQQLAWHMAQGTFREILVSQVIRPTSAKGDGGLDPDDELPPEFQLDLLEQKRFGGRWIRISRLVAITTPEITSVPPARPKGVAARADAASSAALLNHRSLDQTAPVGQ